MKTIFFEKLQNLEGRIIIELLNSANDYAELNFPDVKDLKLSINKIYDRTVIDERNSEQKIHVQFVFPIAHEKASSGIHFMFTIRFGNDFSCMNVYFKRLLDNPVIEELATTWITKNYDRIGDKFEADLKEAFCAGYKSKK